MRWPDRQQEKLRVGVAVLHDRKTGDHAAVANHDDVGVAVVDAAPHALHRPRPSQTLLDAIAGVDDSKLNEPIIKDPNTPFSSVYVTLHGGVQHDLYHAGQIAILKKALNNL